MDQTEDNVLLVVSSIWPKPGQSRLRALIAAGVILVVCAIASGIGGTWLPLGTRVQPSATPKPPMPRLRSAWCKAAALQIVELAEINPLAMCFSFLLHLLMLSFRCRLNSDES